MPIKEVSLALQDISGMVIIAILQTMSNVLQIHNGTDTNVLLIKFIVHQGQFTTMEVVIHPKLLALPIHSGMEPTATPQVLPVLQDSNGMVTAVSTLEPISTNVFLGSIGMV